MGLEPPVADDPLVGLANYFLALERVGVLPERPALPATVPRDEPAIVPVAGADDPLFLLDVGGGELHAAYWAGEVHAVPHALACEVLGGLAHVRDDECLGQLGGEGLIEPTHQARDGVLEGLVELCVVLVGESLACDALRLEQPVMLLLLFDVLTATSRSW